MRQRKRVAVTILLLMFLSACDHINVKDLWTKQTLFQIRDPKSTGINFRNDITETHEYNVITYPDFYSGGGVSIGDINNDGLPDIFFTANMEQNRLYLNEGHFKFKDITKEAGLIEKDHGWCAGTTMVDINNDGYLDIYICKSGTFESDRRRNELYVNNGNGTFTEKAHDYGIDHPGYGVNAAFFDYDHDGDLDMYLVNQGPTKIGIQEGKALRDSVDYFSGDKLYEHVGNRFIDVTTKSGMYSSVIGFGHGVAVGDFNQDGWDDLYVSNDFFEHDYLYFNNGDKTFRESMQASTKHSSSSSMGNDAADINNDGLQDIVVVDMVAEDNRRRKMNLEGMSEGLFDYAVKNGYLHQYMFNTLQLNQGNEKFSEIGELAGVTNTDWSWAAIFADFDDDGWLDLYVTNGMRKDIRNIDWGIYYTNMLKLSYGKNKFSSSEWDDLLSLMPSEPLPNYMFRNNGDLSFQKVSVSWGTAQPSFSGGVAYADLDNDGDLDLVVNNIDDFAFVYENHAEKLKNRNFLNIRFQGSDANPMGLGTKVRLYHHGKMQFQQYFLTRGYRSSMEPMMHFGLGADTLVDELQVTWPDGKRQELKQISANKTLILKYSEANSPTDTTHHINPVFTDVTREIGLDLAHEENPFNDFGREVMLPHRLSDLGPALAVADVNADGLEDFYLTGSFRRRGYLFLQQPDGTFRDSGEDPWQTDRLHEEVGATFLDFDHDGDQDLYVVCGGNEFDRDDKRTQDMLYINDGKGHFTPSEGLLPKMSTSGSKAIPFDFNKDGQTDLLVLGRQVPGHYPEPADSYLLQNVGGKFRNVTGEIAPELSKLGMVTDAVITDYDGDGDDDIILVGEWMPITILKNESGKYVKQKTVTGLENSQGWWSAIVARDFDGDGDQDLLAGNWGLNSRFKTSPQEPFQLYYDDFDNNKKKDIVFGYYENHILYPFNSLHYSAAQIPSITEKYPTNNSFALATLEEVYGKDKLNEAGHFEVKTFANSYFENLGSGKFERYPLPNTAQLSCINSILIDDFNADGHQDAVMAGNFYGTEVQTMRNDAGMGVFMQGDDHGHFKIIPNRQCGLYIDGDVRDMKFIDIKGKKCMLVARNNDTVMTIGYDRPAANHELVMSK